MVSYLNSFSLCYGWPSMWWDEVIKEGLEDDHVKRHREGMEADHEKRIRGAVKRARTEILNNGSTGGNNDAVPNL